jgi:hypothetical protein
MQDMSDRQSDAWPPAASRKCVLVLGMHRSGTSALTRVLNLLGSELPKHILSANDGNEAGYWEPERLVTLHDEMLAECGSRWDDWRPFDLGALGDERFAHYKAEIARLIEQEYTDAPRLVIKDPRICRFVRLYEEVLRALDILPLYVLQLRNPLGVMKSLALRDGMTAPFASLVWLRHVLDAEKATRDKPCTFISYERLINDWQGAVSTIGAHLDLAWPPPPRAAAAVESFLSRELMHYSPSTDELIERPDIAAWVKEAYLALSALEKGRDLTAARAALDKVRAAFDAAVLVFGDAVFSELRAREDKLTTQNDKLNQELILHDADASRLQAEVNVLERRMAEWESRVALTLSEIYASTSWRITAPLRVARNVLSNLRHNSKFRR